MTKNYDIASKTEKGRKKESHEPNGDFIAWLESTQCVVVALADGVGSCTNDAEASKTTCEQFLEKCKPHLSNPTALDKETLHQFCQEIDPILAKKGQMACFCAIVWQPDKNQAVWFHVGDTRIYRHSRTQGLEQITTDDHGKPVVRRVNGKVHTDHGAVVAAIPIDKAVGDGQLKYHTGQCDFLPGESLVLCSDGMYQTAAFDQMIKDLLESADLAAATKKVSTTDDDDASLLILRRVDEGEHDLTLDDLERGTTSSGETIPNNILLQNLESLVRKGLSDAEQEGRLAKLIMRCGEQRRFMASGSIEQLYAEARKQYDQLPSDDPRKRGLERLAVALQRYAADARRFG